MRDRVWARRRLVLASLVAVASLLGGCQDRDGIRSYTVAPPSAPSREARPEQAPPVEGEYRILGAMVPADNPTWFFRYSGAAADVGPQAAEFDKFLKGVQFPNGTNQPPQMELPAGWNQSRAGGFRFATVSFTAGGKSHEIAVSTAMGGLQSNLERWWTSLLGNKKRNDGNYLVYTSPVAFPGGIQGVRVDMTGPKNPSSGMPAMPAFK